MFGNIKTWTTFQHDGSAFTKIGNNCAVCIESNGIHREGKIYPFRANVPITLVVE